VTAAVRQQIRPIVRFIETEAGATGRLSSLMMGRGARMATSNRFLAAGQRPPESTLD
jgi:hypothetical protein